MVVYVETMSQISKENYSMSILFKISNSGKVEKYCYNSSFVNSSMMEELIIKAEEIRKEYSKDNLEIKSFCEKFSKVGKEEISWLTEYKVNENKYIQHSIMCSYPLDMDSLHRIVCEFIGKSEKEIEKGNYQKYEELLNKELYSRKLSRYGILPGSNAILLDNGNYLINDRFASKLTFIVNHNEVELYSFKENNTLREQINTMWGGAPKFMYGKYWVSKKGTKCFKPSTLETASHILVEVSWNKYSKCQGDTKFNNIIYSRITSSRSGQSGTNYYVISVNSLCVYSENYI